jgi:segregation and condensation protein B
MHVKPDIEDKIMSLAPATQMNKAMLKTLAVIASEGPIRQSELVRRRGNRVYHYAEKLLAEGLITAKKSGRTKLLSTTPKFKEYFKIKEVPRLEAQKEPEVEPIAAPEPPAEENENHVQFDMK